MNHRISGRRLAAAVLTLATVTAVTGTLVTVPATAATAGTTAEGRCLPGAPGLLPVGAEIVSAGAFGYITACKDENGETVRELHKPDGTVSTFGNYVSDVYDAFSDWIVTNNQGTISAHNPVTGTYSNHTLSGELVGVAYNVAYESRPAESGEGRELWQLRNDNGVVNKTKLTHTFANENDNRIETAHKVVAGGRDANGRPAVIVLIRGEEGGVGGRTPYFKSAVVPVPSGTAIPQEWENAGGDWDAAATGALTSKYRAWITNRAGGGQQITLFGPGIAKDIALTDIPGKAVLAGVIGDTALYAAQRDPFGDPSVLTPLYARNVATGGAPYKVMENFSSVAHAGDGSLMVRGATSAADGLFSIGKDGTVTPTLVADTGKVVALKVTGWSVPASVNLEKAGTSVPMTFDLTRPDATVDVTLTHTRTGKKLTVRLPQPPSGNRFSYTWDGILDGISAPNGAYTWQATARTLGGGAYATATGSLTVSRTANPHDFNDNGSTDLLARDSAGVLWRDDLYDWPVGGQAKPAKRTKIGPGWNTYKQIEAVGNIGGGAHGDLIALDTTGVLWQYVGKGDGTFATRVRVGGGWGGYTKLAGGSDLGADGKADLFATDTAGVLWFYPGTGDPVKPYLPRIRMGAGWGVYNQLTAVGNIAGDAGGDLIARDKDGVLWLYPSKGYVYDTRVRVGGGWGGFTQFVGAGDVTGDGRPDLIAYGPGGTYVYRSNGTLTGVFTRQTTSLYAGEGSKFNSIA
ncbi:hypothetical protein [Streptomyces sp. SJL17-1]|uniref:hypothetical protein n=1 Tax=Streptomyces sp. SJL17-1 TaxID=2967223 RepID=UPI00296679CA|nr:hypothetical protein [Streptomyces sp. SJL17-1]